MTFSRRNNKRNNFENFNLDKKMDKFIEAGRQFVDGVSGARPGTRRNSNFQEFSKRNAKQVSQWVSKKMDSIFDDESYDEYQEDWYANNDYEEQAELKSFKRSNDFDETYENNYKRPLEAISLRESQDLLNEEPKKLPPNIEYIEEDWPDESNFKVNQWHRSDNETNASNFKPKNDLQNKSQLRKLPKSRRSRT